MAKNLKIKVKNAQLAEALKLKKLKKSEVKEPEKKEDDAPKKPPVKATKEPKMLKRKATYKPSSQEKAKEPEKVSEPTPVAEKPTPVKEKATAAPAEAEKPKAKATSKPKIGSIRPGTDKKALAETAAKKKEEREQKPEKVDSPKQPQKEASTSDDREKTDPKKKTFNKEKPFSFKGLKKGFGEKSSFDSRARHGLQSEDEGQWRRRRPGFKKHKKSAQEQPIIRPSSLSVKLPITIKDLAQNMKLKAAELIQKLLMQGITATINDYLDDETTVQLLGEEFGCEITIDTSEEQRLNITDKSIKEEILEQSPDDLVDRAPVIAFMGHVDHGKTSLIDAIRKTNVTSQEAGAITQHIGAFRSKTSHGYLTILDTPGHEAFSSMRTRGSEVTDLVVLVIAGDEGIKPQTDEAIQQALNAKAPIVVAINKCDKPGFNPDDVYRQLADRNLLPEAWGGEIITVNCSAVTGQGLDQLLEMVALQAEILELQSNPKVRARGTVLESELRKGLGATATLLVQNGTLKQGDALVIDYVYGRVKTMHDEHGKSVTEAGPSYPVNITGLSDLPEAGCEFIVVANEKEAKKLCTDRKAGRERELLKSSVRSLESLLQENAEAQVKKELKIILKADVQGSLEAIKQSLQKIPSKKVEPKIISSGVGEISESDVELAAASNAIIIGFHTQIESHAESMIKQHNVKIEMFDVIYHLIDEVKKEMTLLLDKIRQENYAATAEVKQIFKASSLGSIAGCMVVDGVVKKNHYVRVFRDGEEIYAGTMASLKRLQDDAKEVAKGLECGILLQNFNKVQAGDEIKTYEITYYTPEL